MANSGFRSLLAYQKSFSLASSIWRMTKHFLKEERYSLTDQIRRSSRSVSANLAEGYGRRSYPKHFVSKLADCISENYGTQVWLDFSLDSGYINKEVHEKYIDASEEVGKLLSYMVANPAKFLKNR
jgi:four helix bundle protein